MSAIFISHSSADNAVADEMRRWLDGEGHRSVFLDFNPDSGIAAGQDWEQKLYREIRACRAVIVLCSRASMDSKWCFTEITHARAMGKELFPVRIDDCVVEGVFSDRQVVDFAHGKDQAYERLRIGLMAAGLDPADAFDWDNSRPPYPGLVAFQEQDAAIYFGRDDEIRDGLDRLGKIHRLGTTALLMVLGASGTGKSSLVRAGLIPRMRRDTDRWVVLDPVRPHDDIVRGVARSFAKAFTAAGRPLPAYEVEARLVAALGEVGPGAPATTTDGGATARVVYKGSSNPFLELAVELREASDQDDARVLMIIDQFEELLSDPTGAGTRFLALVRDAVERQDGPLVVLGTMRSDFLKELQEDPALVHLDEETLSLGPMPPRGFVDMIAKPAALSGIELEDGLIAEMVKDADDGGALPLLAFTLQQLHDRFGVDKHLALVEYRDQLGGLRGSIATVADELVRGVPPDIMDLLRKAFLSMTRVTEDGVFARRSRRFDELPEPIHGLIGNFVDSGLLVSRADGDAPIIEVAHEALYSSWGVLAGWLKQSAEALRLQHDIDVAARRWDAGGRLGEDLLRGGRLERSRELIDAGDLPLDDLDREFVEASEEAERAEAERVARRRRRVFQAVTVGLAIAVVLGSFAFFKWREAVIATERAAGARLTTVAQASAENDTDMGMLAAVASLGINQTEEAWSDAWSALATAMSQPVLARAALEGHAAAVSGVAVSPDGRRLVSVDWDGFVRLWDPAAGDAIGLIDEPELVSANSVAFSPDGNRIAVGGLGLREVESVFAFYSGVWVFDAESGDLVAGPLTAPPGADVDDEVWALAFSPDGSQLVSADLNGHVLLWDLAGAESLELFAADPQAEVRSVGPVAFHPDGATIVVGGYDWEAHDERVAEGSLAGTIWVFDAATGEMRESLPTDLDEVVDLAYSPDGEFLASTSLEGLLSLWFGDLSGSVGATQVSGSGAFGNAVSFSPDGAMLATANSDGTVSIFDGDSSNLIQDPLNAHLGGALDVAFGEGVLYSGGANGGVRRYDLDNGQSIGRKTLEQNIEAWSDFAAGRSQIASLNFDTIQVWDAGTGAAFGDPIVADESLIVLDIAMSPDGRLLAALALDDDLATRVVLWDAVTGGVVGDPLVVDDAVDWLAFSHDGTLLATGGSFAGVLEIWDLRLGPAQVGKVVSDDVAGWLGFVPDGTAVASTDFEGRVQFWDVASGAEVGSALVVATDEEAGSQPAGQDRRVNAIAFHPDGERLATGSNDNKIRLWNLDSGEQIGEDLLGHGGPVLDVAFSPEGDLLVSASQDTTVVFRRMADLENRIELAGHKGPVRSLSFIAEGSAVVSADDRGTVRLWPTPGFWQSLACRSAGRNLTLEEWTDIVGTERAYERQCADLPAGEGAPADAKVVTVGY